MYQLTFFGLLLLLFPVIFTPVTATPLITDSKIIFSVPSIIDLPYLTPVTDPVFGTKITRIANETGQPTTPVNGVWGSDARHHYSKDQPWNSDGSLLVLQNKKSGGTPKQLYLDGNTYQPKFGICSNYNLGDDRWHPSKQHPRERINVKNSTLEWFDVVSCTQTRSWTLPFAVNYFGSGEGNTSVDGRFVALADNTRMFLVDMEPQAPFATYASGNRRLGPIVDISNCGLSTGCTVGHVSVSPSGKYVIVSYKSDHIRVFDINPQTLTLTPRPMPTGSPQCSGHDPAKGYIFDLGHADMTLNPFDNNEDVIIGQRRSWCPSTVNGKTLGRVIMVRLKDNTITSLTRSGSDVASAHHISARNYDRPGWIYVSFHSYPGENRLFNDELVAIKIDGSNAVERFVHRQVISFNGCYRCEAHGVPSRDGKRILWAKAKIGSVTEIKAHVVDARQSTPTNPVPGQQTPVYWRNQKTGVNDVYFMNGANIVSQSTINTVVDLDWRIVATGDFDGDGKTDLLWRHRVTGSNWLYLMNGKTITQSLLINQVANLNWKIIGTGDLNGDGRTDIVWRHSQTGRVWVYLMNGANILSSQHIAFTGLEWDIKAIEDLDGDRRDDILWRNHKHGRVWAFFMDGSTIHDSLPIAFTGLEWKIKGVGDFNGDGRADILWHNPISRANWIYLMNGPRISKSAGLNRLSDLNYDVALIKDLNGDNKADILWRNTMTGENRLYEMNALQIQSNTLINQVPNMDWEVIK